MDDPSDDATAAATDPPEPASSTEIAPPRRRWSVALLSLALAALFGWAARTLPWQEWTAFAVITGVLAALHLATAVCAALGLRWLRIAWRAQSVAALGYFAYLAYGLLSSAWYIGNLYGGLGPGIGLALVAICGLVALFTVPFSLWGLVATGGVSLRGTWGRPLSLLLLLGVGVVGWKGRQLARQADGEPLPAASQLAALEKALSSAVHTLEQRAVSRRQSLMTSAAVECKSDAAALSMVATYAVATRAKRPRVSVRNRCFQGASTDALAAALRAALEADGWTGSSIKIDVLTRRMALPEGQPISSLTVRAGLDGVCAAGRCLMPWQLVALDVFTSETLIKSVPDAKLGVSFAKLRKLLKVPADAPLAAVSTHNLLIKHDGAVEQLARSPRRVVAVTSEELQQASKLAQQHILLAQSTDGRFRYMTQPFTGKSSNRGFSLARQAGTTLVLCELSQDARWTDRVTKRSLKLIAKLERRLPDAANGEASLLVYPAKAKRELEGVGGSALSLAAFLTCRRYIGKTHDALIGRLARTLLQQQRENGSFRHRLAPATGEPLEGGSLYVDGQAVLALSLLEAVADENPEIFPARQTLHDAVERAMRFYAEDYWQVFTRKFFMLEENWHCLAARASLPHHRHDGYEQLCLDYVQFKKRITLDDASGVHPDFLGGYAIGNIVPPHNTATAGFGEAMAAALAIKQARGEDIAEDAAIMKSTMGFLLRNQYQTDCFACSTKVRATGGFSEHMASPYIRIDYVQHAWAALGHGARALDLLPTPAKPAAAGSAG